MKIKPFEKMTAAQKRVAIARDVLLQLKSDIYQPGCCYALLYNNSAINQKSVKAESLCGVCAIGAAMLSGIRLGNHFSFNSPHADGQQTRAALSSWFDSKQVDEMEAAYERFPQLGSKKALAFGKRFGWGLPRMTAIFRNIITNKGTFKP